MKKRKSVIYGIREMFQILWNSGRLMTCLLVFNNLIRNTLWPLRALIVGKLVDVIVQSSAEGFARYEKEFVIYSAAFFLLFALNRIWWPLNSYTQTLMLARISDRSKRMLMDVMEKTGLVFFDDPENADLYSRAQTQIDGRQPINAVNKTVGLISLTISFATAFVGMVSVSIPVTVILLLSSLPAVLWENRFNERIYEFDQKSVREKRFMQYLFAQLVDKRSAKEIKTFQAENFIGERHDASLHEYIRKYLKLVNMKFVVDIPLWLILQAALMTSYYMIIAKTGEGTLELGSLSFFLAVAVSLQDAIKNFGSSFNGIVKSGKYFNVFQELTRKEERDSEKKTYVRIPEKIETIEFRNVSFSYPNLTEKAVDSVSFLLRNPQAVIMVGENGAGKTTLVKLLLGFYKPTSGEILVNGVNIDDYKPEEYFALFSVCFQDYMKYAFSFRNNILLGEPGDEERYQKVVAESQLDEVLARLPDRDETYLSREFDESGTELSGGQYNRIAIARAMYRDSSAVVFDEPNAALDAKAERNLFEIYERLTGNKLGIMITHRLSTAVKADLILVMKNGKLVESGTHQDLMQKNGEYAQMFSMQAKHYV
jgi:ABC-type multidrug transport system fused ATPase/permease subunit